VCAVFVKCVCSACAVHVQCVCAGTVHSCRTTLRVVQRWSAGGVRTGRAGTGWNVKQVEPHAQPRAGQRSAADDVCEHNYLLVDGDN
jgi:hypothetical protein